MAGFRASFSYTKLFRHEYAWLDSLLRKHILLLLLLHEYYGAAACVRAGECVLLRETRLLHVFGCCCCLSRGWTVRTS